MPGVRNDHLTSLLGHRLLNRILKLLATYLISRGLPERWSVGYNSKVKEGYGQEDEEDIDNLEAKICKIKKL